MWYLHFVFLRYKHTVLNLQNMFRMINIHRQLRIQVNRYCELKMFYLHLDYKKYEHLHMSSVKEYYEHFDCLVDFIITMTTLTTT